MFAKLLRVMRARSVGAIARLLLMPALMAAALLQPAKAQDEADQVSTGDGNELSISLLTFGPGDLYWERFGHDAILVRDRSNGSALAYNYGYFDFNQPDFFLNFARGYMTYRVAADPLRYDLNLYRHEHRWVVEQTLALTPQQRERLRDFLVWNTQAEHAEYRYDYFLANCATRVRDALDLATDGALSQQLKAQPTKATYRLDAVRLIAPDRLFSMAMDLALGPTADRPVDLWAESFVPMVLMDALQSVQVKDAQGRLNALVGARSQLLEGSIAEPPSQPPDYRVAFLLSGLLLAALLLVLAALRARFAARFAFALIATALALLSGIGGVIFAAIWGLSQHWAGWHNLNLLLFDPLSLLLIPALLMSMRANWQPPRFVRQLTRLIALGGLLALATYWLTHIQQNLQWILLMLPPQLALSIALRKQAAA